MPWPAHQPQFEQQQHPRLASWINKSHEAAWSYKNKKFQLNKYGVGTPQSNILYIYVQTISRTLRMSIDALFEDLKANLQNYKHTQRSVVDKSYMIVLGHMFCT